MKHYKNKDGAIFAFELDGSQDFLITPDMVPISDNEIKSLMGKASIEEWRKTACISKVQAKLNLKSAGLLSKVMMLMDSLDPTDDIRILWDDSVQFNRNNIVLIEFCQDMLKLKSEEIDNLFLVN